MKSHFFVVGAQRCGTTSLHHYLSEHPQICMGNKKEIHYYSIEENYRKGKKWYLKHFENCSEKQITGDASPLYIYLDYVPERIAKDYKNAKLIFILRNPTERAWSHYSWQIRRGLEFLSFEKAIKKENTRIQKSFFKKRKFSYLDRGKYIVQIKHYLKCFSKKQMLFIFSEDLRDNLNAVMKNICQFLEIENVSYENISKVEINKNKIPHIKLISFIVNHSFLEKNKYISRLNQKYNLKDNNKQINPETKKYLKDYFRKYNEDLKEFLCVEKLNW